MFAQALFAGELNETQVPRSTLNAVAKDFPGIRFSYDDDEPGEIRAYHGMQPLEIRLAFRKKTGKLLRSVVVINRVDLTDAEQARLVQRYIPNAAMETFKNTFKGAAKSCTWRIENGRIVTAEAALLPVDFSPEEEYAKTLEIEAEFVGKTGKLKQYLHSLREHSRCPGFLPCEPLAEFVEGEVLSNLDQYGKQVYPNYRIDSLFVHNINGKRSFGWEYDEECYLFDGQGKFRKKTPVWHGRGPACGP
ncbi:MAG: hypothetical protein OHK0011_13360 [Turneriella sp.]